MKALRQVLLFALLLISFPHPCLGMISVGELTKEEAAERGITMKSRPNGDAGIMLWLEIEKDGKLGDFTYCELRVADADGNHVLSAMLKPNPVVHGQPDSIISVAFSAQPDQLSGCEFWVVSYAEPLNGVGYILPVKKFLDLNKVSK